MSMSSRHGPCESLEKLQRVPAVDFVCKTCNSTYDWAKNLNFVTLYWFLTMEKMVGLVCSGISPVLHRFEGPIGLVDRYSSNVIDKVHTTMPVLFSSSGEALMSTKTHLLNSSIVQLSLNITEHSLSMLEKAVTILPGTEVADVNNTSHSSSEPSSTILSSTFHQMYRFAVFPLRITAQLIHKNRTSLKLLQNDSRLDNQQDCTVESKSDTNKIAQNQRILTFTEKVLFLPIQALHVVGQFSQKRAALKMMSDPEIDQQDKQSEKDKLMTLEDSNLDLELSTDDDDNNDTADELGNESKYVSANATLQEIEDDENISVSINQESANSVSENAFPLDQSKRNNQGTTSENRSSATNSQIKSNRAFKSTKASSLRAAAAHAKMSSQKENVLAQKRNGLNEKRTKVSGGADAKNRPRTIDAADNLKEGVKIYNKTETNQTNEKQIKRRSLNATT